MQCPPETWRHQNDSCCATIYVSQDFWADMGLASCAVKQAAAVIDKALKQRVTASHRMNATSSRSHLRMRFQRTVIQQVLQSDGSMADSVASSSSFTLMDLAGERQDTLLLSAILHAQCSPSLATTPGAIRSHELAHMLADDKWMKAFACRCCA